MLYMCQLSRSLARDWSLETTAVEKCPSLVQVYVKVRHVRTQGKVVAEDNQADREDLIATQITAKSPGPPPPLCHRHEEQGIIVAGTTQSLQQAIQVQAFPASSSRL